MTPLHSLINTFETKHLNNLISFTETMHAFLDRKADINLQNESKSSLLHLAVAKPNYTAVSILANQPNINLMVNEI